MDATQDDSSTAPARSSALHRRRIQAPSLADEAYELLKGLIVQGELAPGERLLEPALCRRLGISRTPLRDALNQLAGEGLVTLRRNRNALVTRLDGAELRHLFEVEAGLEAMAVELAALRMTATELKRLTNLQERLEKQHAKGDRDGYFATNTRIHALLVAAARNPVLVETHQRLLGRLERARYLALDKLGRWQESTDEHRAILDALHARDPDLARRRMHDHVMHTGVAISGLLAP
ncbi:GntR family transcriptional regulator [Halomonas denitrificans]|uniref:GntR family transcriptional regulator n=1 Tax=Halomonas TaxID=2745 RepID=UPI001C98BB29|nr:MULTISPECIES: GntR family transcriptional regulator [Halomonas]MBY5926660.1 GntR family transcriptional regulator [Halomonas sp. DP4Y7-2]MBY5967733.1 GntR family transcriptional regulator [Halomonas denitrificans]MBY5983235.1 GntR family transcriptional regulator [Halomonas sp. DP5Y7-2]MBY6206028.1 GntR family transcriptional regulator [Halomonas sp. DP3Y7-2]MBY6228081.1 GntR family transcriptional regulator [Halomonas sp. DP3Y7-1]